MNMIVGHHPVGGNPQATTGSVMRWAAHTLSKQASSLATATTTTHAGHGSMKYKLPSTGSEPRGMLPQQV